MNAYACFWKGQKVIVNSDTTYHAQQLAVSEFKRVAGRRKVASHDITVMLVEKDNKEVTHNPNVIG